MTTYISLGTLCHTAKALKTLNLRKSAYPFDWCFITPLIIKDCLENNFEVFMNRAYHSHISSKKSGHALYGYNFFNHKDITSDKDYQYYKRAIERFRKVLTNDKDIVFIISFYNNTEDVSDYIEKTTDFLLSEMKKHILKPFRIVCLTHKIKKDYEFTMETKNDYIINVCVSCTATNGVRFKKKRDREMFEYDLNHVLCCFPTTYIHEYKYRCFGFI